MYGAYEGINQALAADDSAGVQAVDGVRQFDAYNINGRRNITAGTAANITGNFGSNAQIAIPSLDITTGGQSEWFYLTVPSTTNGTMTVTAQSSNLSSLSPKLMVYNSSLCLVGQAAAPNSMGATVTVSTTVAAGQGYYIKVLAAAGNGAIGGWGLLVNAGSQTQAAIPPPNTVVAQQPDQGGGSLTNGVTPIGSGNDADPTVAVPVYTTIGALRGWALVYTGAPSAPANPVVTPVLGIASPVPPSPAPPPVAPIVAAPSPTASPVVLAPITPTKHHAKVRNVNVPRFAVGHRIRQVQDHPVPKHHHK
jgi:hypothetical protein